MTGWLRQIREEEQKHVILLCATPSQPKDETETDEEEAAPRTAPMRFADHGLNTEESVVTDKLQQLLVRKKQIKGLRAL